MKHSMAGETAMIQPFWHWGDLCSEGESGAIAEVLSPSGSSRHGHCHRFEQQVLTGEAVARHYEFVSAWWRKWAGSLKGSDQVLHQPMLPHGSSSLGRC